MGWRKDIPIQVSIQSSLVEGDMKLHTSQLCSSSSISTFAPTVQRGLPERAHYPDQDSERSELVEQGCLDQRNAHLSGRKYSTRGPWAWQWGQCVTRPQCCKLHLLRASKFPHTRCRIFESRPQRWLLVLYRMLRGSSMPAWLLVVVSKANTSPTRLNSPANRETEIDVDFTWCK